MKLHSVLNCDWLDALILNSSGMLIYAYNLNFYA